jgi:DNA (cytosine-5)-methyltransferase 1
MNYYNEFDPKAAAWLRELIKAGHIPAGDVDERSIEDVTPNDLKGYTQCHFFAGIGGWSYALQLAGWPSDRPVWTGSCPCQPFSRAAGKGKGFTDERHLWPAFDWLISECRPGVVFGEQVANNLVWLDLVSGDLEAKGYAFGAAVLGAHSVGAPHIRQRLYWVGHSHEPGLERQQSAPSVHESGKGSPWASGVVLRDSNDARRVVEPGSFPLAHGVPERVGLLRGYGNAIVPQVAAAFIKASGV